MQIVAVEGVRMSHANVETSKLLCGINQVEESSMEVR